MAKRVFISYSHDSEAHRQWVLELANRLRREGLDAWIDRYEPVPPEGWPLWMEKQCRQADVILAVCTAEYRQRFEHTAEQGTGKGVKYEAHILRGVLYNNELKADRILPVLPDHEAPSAIPEILSQHTFFRLPSAYEDLYRHLTAQPEVIPPEMGEIVELPVCSEGAVEQTEEPIASYQNPFDPYHPAIGDSFVGRHSELVEVENILSTGGSVSLVGDRRIGKTSFILKVAEQEEKAGRTVRTVDGNGSAGACPKSFVSTIIGGPVSENVEEAANAFDRWARDAIFGNLRPLVIVDEFDGLITRFPYRFLERLRPMMDRLHLILVTHREIDRIYDDLPKGSPFDNRMRMKMLGLLEADAMTTLLRRGAPVLTSTDQQRIGILCGRHPFYATLLAERMYTARINGTGVQMAEEDFLMDASRHLRGLWRHLNNREREVLRAAVVGQPMKMPSLRARGFLNSDGSPFGKILSAVLTQEGYV